MFFAVSHFSHALRRRAFRTDQVPVVRNDERPVRILVDKAKFPVKLHSDPDRVDGKPLAISLDFGLVKGDDDLSDLPGEPPMRVDGFEAEHLIEDDIVCASVLAHKEVNRFRGHKVDLQFQPEKAFFIRQAYPPL